MITPETYRAIVSGQRNDFAAASLRAVLSLAERPYRIVVALRNRRYDRGHAAIHRVEVPVISVGNLTLGGTGKTPMVAWLARWFRDHNVPVSLISRGYGASAPGGNDELQELAASLPDVPHLQNPDRVAAARTAIDQHNAKLIILDDAFQHRRIARDLDMVLIDATEPFGYGHVFPRGMLREPMTGLCRADVVALTRCNLVPHEQRLKLRSQIETLAPQAIRVEVAQRPARLLSASGDTIQLDQLPSGALLGFCGIGNPGAFRQTLTEQGWPIDGFRTFPDHHPYDRSTLDALQRWIEDHPNARSLVCTHKDLVKIGVDHLGRLPLFALTLELVIETGGEALEAKLRDLLPR